MSRLFVNSVFRNYLHKNMEEDEIEMKVAISRNKIIENQIKRMIKMYEGILLTPKLFFC